MKTEANEADRALEDFYEDWNRPTGFTTAQFLQEILLSYKLLFANSRGGQKIWQQRERAKASYAAGGFNDPILEKLCGPKDSSARDGRLSYSMTSDFPIFAQRLQCIQDDILRQQPNRLSALWNDRREPLRWYTFWAVLAIGFIGLLLAVFQVITSVLQTVYTIKGYNAP